MSRKGIMLAYPFEEKRLLKWKPPYLVQPKYDGERCRAVPAGDGYLLLSSEENTIFSVPLINQFMKKLRYTGYEFDGELYWHGKSFEHIHSIVGRTRNLSNEHDNITFHIFDIADESLPQVVRLSLLQDCAGKLAKGTDFIAIAPLYLCESLEDIMSVYDIVTERGYEGIIVRHCDAPYVRKRSIYMMKFKPKKEDNYEIIGVVEEVSIEGIPKGALGALVVKDQDNSVFRVGTGFTREMRQTLWSKREELPGKIARVQYQHLTAGNKVPRFPVFVEVVG